METHSIIKEEKQDNYLPDIIKIIKKGVYMPLPPIFFTQPA
jgi:hypothetical protein